MPTLPLAVGIADTVIEAEQQGTVLDVETAADELLENHPGADASREEIVETLVEETGQATAA